MPKMGIRGFNATIPHKVDLISLVDEISLEAKIIGAINTVKFDENGKSFGINTDYIGFVQNLLNFDKDAIKDKTAVVFGAGGASRAVCFGLVKYGIKKIYLCNRTFEKAQILSNDIEKNIIIPVYWEKRSEILKDADLVVNSTSIGLKKDDFFDVNFKNLKNKAIVTDLIYNPLMTDFLIKAAEEGANIVTGLGMLIYQALPVFELWFGVKPEIDNELMERLVI
jgi:shikimate dehydrogenase